MRSPDSTRDSTERHESSSGRAELNLWCGCWRRPRMSLRPGASVVRFRLSYAGSSVRRPSTQEARRCRASVVFEGVAVQRRGGLQVCGIIGYVGPRAAKPLLMRGLERLEYRGYDSAGIAPLEKDGLGHVRAV